MQFSNVDIIRLHHACSVMQLDEVTSLHNVVVNKYGKDGVTNK